MDSTYWLQQTDKPLFEDTIWSQPEQRSLAGKLGIIGGNLHGFSSISEAYSAALKSGTGVARTLMPDSLSKTLGSVWPESDFAPSTKSGGFSSKALVEWLAFANWADATIVAGDLGHNSETSILLERFVEKEPGHITLAGDSITLISETPLALINRENLLLAPDFAQLQRLLTAIRFPTALTSNLTLFQLVDLLHSLTASYPLSILYINEGQASVASNGRVSTTQLKSKSIIEAATACAVWRLQQPTKPFEAMTSAIYRLNQN